MARPKGKPMFGSKTRGRGIQGSYFITKDAWKLMRSAAKRIKKSDSDVIEFCLRAVAGSLTAAVAQGVVAGEHPSVADGTGTAV